MTYEENKTLATYAAISAVVNNHIAGYEDILECLESACNIVRFEIAKLNR